MVPSLMQINLFICKFYCQEILKKNGCLNICKMESEDPKFYQKNILKLNGHKFPQSFQKNFIKSFINLEKHLQVNLVMC